MSYKEKPILKLYKYENNTFVLQSIIDDYAECSIEHNLYQAGQFSIAINYNIPNALLFDEGLWVQFGSNPYDFGEITSVTDSIGQDGKGSQRRVITGYDARYIFKRRIIKSLNNENTWTMTAKGELCLRNLIADQCGSNAETKRRLPVINTIPTEVNAIGKEYSVSESFTNLYEVLTTIATQSEIGWRINFDGTSLTLECYEGTDRSSSVRFDTNYDSLASGTFTASKESFANTVYVGGKGQGSERDIYEGEIGTPEGLSRYESWDNQSSMTTESEYEKEALSILTQYGQTLQVNGQGLVQSPYIFRSQYDIGDKITLSFSGKSAVVQILSVTEHWTWNNHGLTFSFGKPQPTLQDQLQIMLKRIQKASEKTDSTDSVKYYTIPTDTSMPASDVIYNRIGFIGSVGEGMTFTLYLDDEKTGAKTYHVYIKELTGTGKLTLTTGFENAQNLVLNVGTYVAIVYVDENGNITMAGSTATDTIESGNNLPATSDAISSVVDTIQGEIDGKVDTDSIVDSIIDGNLNPITSNAVYDGLEGKQDELTAGVNIQITDNEIEGVNDLPSDAVLHYSFDELSQETNIVIDNANGQNNAINNGGIAVEGVSGKGIKILTNGTNKAIEVNYPSENWDRAYTVSCWAKTNGASLYLVGIDEVYALQNHYIRYDTNANNIRFDLNEGTRFVSYFCDITLDNDKWYHFAFINKYESGKSEIWINGVKQSTNTTQRTVTQKENKFLIGTSFASSGYYSDSNNSLIDDFQIFNRALSEKEVKALYNNKAQTPKYYSLADYTIKNIRKIPFTLSTNRRCALSLKMQHAYIITLGHPFLNNKLGRYLIYIQSSTRYRIENLLSVNNYTLTIDGDELIITSTTDYGLGYLEDLGQWA